MNELFSIAGKVAVITGAGGVLGGNIAQHLVQQGHERKRRWRTMAKNRKTPDMNLPVWFDGQNINDCLLYTSRCV